MATYFYSVTDFLRAAGWQMIMRQGVRRIYIYIYMWFRDRLCARLCAAKCLLLGSALCFCTPFPLVFLFKGNEMKEDRIHPEACCVSTPLFLLLLL